MTEPTNMPNRRHEIKCWPEHFELIIDGSKTFEIRRNDRNYTAGDTLYLREWRPGAPVGEYTGRAQLVLVTHLIADKPDLGLMNGHVIMSISRVLPCEACSIIGAVVPPHTALAAFANASPVGQSATTCTRCGGRSWLPWPAEDTAALAEADRRAGAAERVVCKLDAELTEMRKKHFHLHEDLEEKRRKLEQAQQAQQAGDREIERLDREILELRTQIAETKAALLDEQKKAENLQLTINGHDNWVRDAKKDAGYTDETSFDVAWNEALAALRCKSRLKAMVEYADDIYRRLKPEQQGTIITMDTVPHLCSQMSNLLRGIHDLAAPKPEPAKELSHSFMLLSGVKLVQELTRPFAYWFESVDGVHHATEAEAIKHAKAIAGHVTCPYDQVPLKALKGEWRRYHEKAHFVLADSGKLRCGREIIQHGASVPARGGDPLCQDCLNAPLQPGEVLDLPSQTIVWKSEASVPARPTIPMTLTPYTDQELIAELAKRLNERE